MYRNRLGLPVLAGAVALALAGGAATAAQKVNRDPVLVAANSVADADLNGLRAARGLPVLRRDAAIDSAAQRHAADMVARRYFDHRRPDGAGARQRIGEAGFRACLVAENIAAGQKSEAEVMAGWAASPAHMRNILNPQVTHYGLGRAQDHWVLVLAQAGC